LIESACVLLALAMPHFGVDSQVRERQQVEQAKGVRFGASVVLQKYVEECCNSAAL
jgi:hypothetical protein